MTPAPDAPRVLVIAGMHRSGTSLTAGWLARCGLDVGARLTRSEIDNPLGHFEDADFLDLHRRILNASGLTYRVTPGQQAAIGEADREAARALIAARAGRTQWGWKEPRTCLFLGFWRELIPQMKVLAVYRGAAEVVDSLRRRDLKRFHHRAAGWRWIGRWRRSLAFTWLNLPALRQSALSWDRHNRDILAFADAHPDDALILHIDDVVAHGDALIGFLNTRWGFHLAAAPIGEMVRPGLLQADSAGLRGRLVAALAPGITRTARDLAAWRDRSLERLEAIPRPAPAGSARSGG